MKACGFRFQNRNGKFRAGDELKKKKKNNSKSRTVLGMQEGNLRESGENNKGEVAHDKLVYTGGIIAGMKGINTRRGRRFVMIKIWWRAEERERRV